MSKTPTQNDWEKRFDKKFVYHFAEPNNYSILLDAEDSLPTSSSQVKDFIRQLLADARKEVIREVEKIPKMKSIKKQIKQKNNPFKVGSEVFIKIENDGCFEGLVTGISDGFVVVKDPLNTQPLSYRHYKINITKILYFYEKS